MQISEAFQILGSIAQFPDREPTDDEKRKIVEAAVTIGQQTVYALLNLSADMKRLADTMERLHG